MTEEQGNLDEADEKSVGILTDRVAEVTCAKCGCEIDVEDLEPFVRVECPDCGNIEIVPAKLGQFLLLDLVGTGGMGGVYYGRDETLGRNVAIKVMLQSLGEDAQFVENFKREAQAAARLNHPNIVQIYSFGQEKGQPYIVMELVTGEGLDKLMEPGRQLDQRLVMQVGADIAEGLMAADEAGLIHGDIKPENILFDEKKHAKLVDFGIASFANQSNATGGSIWGTPYYIAPEKVKRQKVDARADIYSLGATLYHAISGHPPFDGDSPIEVVKARLKHPAQPLNKLCKHIDRNVERTILRMLEQEPAMRYPTYPSLISDLKKVLKALGSSTRPATIKTGRIVVPKRQSGQLAPPPSMSPAMPKRDTRRTARDRGTKIVIHKRGQSTGNSALSGYRNTAVATPDPAPEQAKKPAKPKRKKVSKGHIWGVVIFFILLGISALGVFIKYRHDEKTRQRRERILLAGSVSSATNVYRQVQQVVSNVVLLAGQSSVMEQKATNAVFIIKGEPLDLPKVPVKKPEAGKEKAEKETPKKEPEAPKKTDPDAPPGMMSREELDRLRAMRQGQAVEKKKEEEAKPEPEPEEKKPEPEPEPEEKDPVRIIARNVLKYTGRLRMKHTEAMELGDSALQLRQAALRAQTSQVAGGFVKQLHAYLEKGKELEEGTKGIIDQAEKSLAKLLDKESSILAEREAARKAEEMAAKHAREAAEKERQASAYKEQVQREKDLVETVKIEQQMILKQYKYKEAVDALKQRLTDLQTKEGKAARDLVLEQYSQLVYMKTLLIEKLSKSPYRYGWGRGSGQDILGANERGVRLRGRLVEWHEVSIFQMLKIIEHYLTDRNVKLREQAELSLGAAIYCFETGAGSAGALQKSLYYAQKAIELRSNFEERVKKLLPTSVTEQLL